MVYLHIWTLADLMNLLLVEIYGEKWDNVQIPTQKYHGANFFQLWATLLNLHLAP
jgi:hypothetical protein